MIHLRFGLIFVILFAGTTVCDNQTTVFGLFNLYNKVKVIYSEARIEYLFSRISLRMYFFTDHRTGTLQQNNYGYSFSYGPFTLTDKIMDHERASLPYPKHKLYMRGTRFSLHIIFTAHKRSLGQGNVFTGVCLSTAGEGVSTSWSRGCLSLDLGAFLWVRGGGGVHTPNTPSRDAHTSLGHTHTLDTPTTVNKRAERIPLECFLV